MESEQIIQCQIEDLLRQQIGLNPASVGSSSILRAIKRDMRMREIQSFADYLQRLKTEPAVFEAFVESIVVPETSFFRNQAAFVFLRQWVAKSWPAQRSWQKPLRVLSLPCSTGEEPYSIAIMLLEEGLSLDEFHIDAIDISALAIEQAKKGIYSPYAFRRQTYRSDDKYFVLGNPSSSTSKKITPRYFIIESIRQKVSFSQGNILDPALLLDRPPYDIIFCRNLLIYFDAHARTYTLDLLSRMVKPDGLLFVGYAEANLINPQVYQAVPYPQTFAYRKRSHDDKAVCLPNATTSERSPNSILASPNIGIGQDAIKKRAFAKKKETSDPSGYVSVAHLPKRPDELSADARADLLQARELADKGAIAQAVESCDRYLLTCPTDAQAHLLRGELYLAVDDYMAAAACFEKAIYLDPQLSEALIHLMLIKEARGDFNEAAVMRDRLQRLRNA